MFGPVRSCAVVNTWKNRQCLFYRQDGSSKRLGRKEV